MHLFLSGDKRIGKSTAIQKALRNTTIPYSGFLTVKSTDFWPGKTSVHLLSFSGKMIPDQSNFLFFCGEKNEHVSARFDALSDQLFDQNSRLIIMDELGRFEENAFFFQERIISALNGTIPVLGVLQKCESVFLKKISAHPDVKVIYLTADNRDQVDDEIRTFLLSCS